MTIEILALDLLDDTPARKVRALQDQLVVADYAARMEAGDVFPPLNACRDAAGKVWIWDGGHRLAAARKGQRETFACKVEPGEFAVALTLARKANGLHGLRRSQADKQAIGRGIVEEELDRRAEGQPPTPSRELGALAGGTKEKPELSHTFINKLIAQITEERARTAKEAAEDAAVLATIHELLGPVQALGFRQIYVGITGGVLDLDLGVEALLEALPYRWRKAGFAEKLALLARRDVHAHPRPGDVVRLEDADCNVQIAIVQAPALTYQPKIRLLGPGIQDLVQTMSSTEWLALLARGQSMAILQQAVAVPPEKPSEEPGWRAPDDGHDWLCTGTLPPVPAELLPPGWTDLRPFAAPTAAPTTSATTTPAPVTATPGALTPAMSVTGTLVYDTEGPLIKHIGARPISACLADLRALIAGPQRYHLASGGGAVLTAEDGEREVVLLVEIEDDDERCLEFERYLGELLVLLSRTDAEAMLSERLVPATVKLDNILRRAEHAEQEARESLQAIIGYRSELRRLGALEAFDARNSVEAPRGRSEGPQEDPDVPSQVQGFDSPRVGNDPAWPGSLSGGGRRPGVGVDTDDDCDDTPDEENPCPPSDTSAPSSPTPATAQTPTPGPAELASPSTSGDADPALAPAIPEEVRVEASALDLRLLDSAHPDLSTPPTATDLEPSTEPLTASSPPTLEAGTPSPASPATDESTTVELDPAAFWACGCCGRIQDQGDDSAHVALHNIMCPQTLPFASLDLDNPMELQRWRIFRREQASQFVNCPGCNSIARLRADGTIPPHTRPRREGEKGKRKLVGCEGSGQAPTSAQQQAPEPTRAPTAPEKPETLRLIDASEIAAVEKSRASEGPCDGKIGPPVRLQDRTWSMVSGVYSSDRSAAKLVEVVQRAEWEHETTTYAEAARPGMDYRGITATHKRAQYVFTGRVLEVYWLPPAAERRAETREQGRRAGRCINAARKLRDSGADSIVMADGRNITLEVAVRDLQRPELNEADLAAYEAAFCPSETEPSPVQGPALPTRRERHAMAEDGTAGSLVVPPDEDEDESAATTEAVDEDAVPAELSLAQRLERLLGAGADELPPLDDNGPPWSIGAILFQLDALEAGPEGRARLAEIEARVEALERALDAALTPSADPAPQVVELEAPPAPVPVGNPDAKIPEALVPLRHLLGTIPDHELARLAGGGSTPTSVGDARRAMKIAAFKPSAPSAATPRSEDAAVLASPELLALLSARDPLDMLEISAEVTAMPLRRRSAANWLRLARRNELTMREQDALTSLLRPPDPLELYRSWSRSADELAAHLEALADEERAEVAAAYKVRAGGRLVERLAMKIRSGAQSEAT